MLGNLTGWHLLIVLAVVLLVFGAAKLPALAKSVGQSAKILKAELKTPENDEKGRLTGGDSSVPPAESAEPVQSARPKR